MRIGDTLYSLAPLGRRVMAFLIDVGLLFLFAVAIAVFANLSKTTDFYGREHYSSTATAILAVLWISWAVTLACYWWLQEAGPHHATLGKRAMGLSVLRTDGTALSYRLSFSRGFGHFLSFFIYGLGYWWSFWDSARQTWHDKIAKTIVIDARVPAEAASISPTISTS